LCPRAAILDDGRIAADGPTARLLADADLLARHRLELPYGYDPALAMAQLARTGK
jgi:cobalt/nickel transport system ATP-binding protein